MEQGDFPSIKTLVMVWLVLIGLTLGTMFAGRVSTNEAVGPVLLALLFAVTFLKTNLILGYFLDLRSAVGPWGRVFNGMVLSVLAVVFVLYLF